MLLGFITVSISEADKLELSSLNLNGKWEKNAGTDKFELNFKSTKELVLTQYDGNDEVKVKSDEGAYSVDNGVLNLTVTANGEAITAAATAVLSEKYLIITVTEGNSLFAGTYTANRGDMPNIDVSGTTESKESSDSSQIESSIENSGAQSDVSKPETVIDGYRVQFNADRDTYLGTIETPITNCVVHAVQPQQTNSNIPRAVFEKDARNINNSEDTMEVWFTTDSAFKSDVTYNLRIYFSDIPDAEYELKYDEPFDTSQNHLTLKLHEGHNYYYIQFTANGQEGEPSNIIYQRYDYPSVWDN